MANTVVFNETNINRDTLCFEDLEISNIFMFDYPEARFHFIKVEKGVSSEGFGFNAICIEDGKFDYFEEGRNVKKFIGEIVLNGTFIRE